MPNLAFDITTHCDPSRQEWSMHRVKNHSSIRTLSQPNYTEIPLILGIYQDKQHDSSCSWLTLGEKTQTFQAAAGLPWGKNLKHLKLQLAYLVEKTSNISSKQFPQYTKYMYILIQCHVYPPQVSPLWGQVDFHRSTVCHHLQTGWCLPRTETGGNRDIVL